MRIGSFNVELVDEEDEAGNPHTCYHLTRGDELHRVSPNATQDELVRLVSEIEQA